MNKDNTNCSRTSVERYLLNKMTFDEETAFQKHLHTCDACKACLDAIRNVALLVSDEPLPIASAERKENRRHSPIFNLQLSSFNYRFVSAAACVLLMIGAGTYLWMRNSEGMPHDTHIMHQHRAAVEYADTAWTLLSPESPVSVVNPHEEPVVFRWDRESAFRLQLEADGKTVVDIDSTGTSCTLDTGVIAHYEQLDWTLTIAEKQHKGRLIIHTK